ncbi:type VII secretion protein EsxA [Brevibacillus sp. SKDU10]|uniref:WXG100 family type VII secretion target n=1 Tax=Brevibacillus sp. SKDU10 TaxID=1247872 RepID=UPI0007C8FB0A|nr:WXG100 family type VII secretion target [Brevibacillus sp. SKDU10]OAJ72495.1 type VII secretion protein EsxA [Brevibacillus sp. SKDU10]
MSRILISPDQVDEVASQFQQSKEQSQQVIDRLNQQIHQMEGQWDGMTKQKFFQEFQEANRQMTGFVLLLESISNELHAIATKFRQADSQ